MREGAYALYDDRANPEVCIEQAICWKDGLQKPISCHMYSIRVKNYDDFDAELCR